MLKINDSVFCHISPLYSTTSTIILKSAGEAIVIDPSISESDLIEIINLAHLRKLTVLVTHHHWDHIITHHKMNLVNRHSSNRTINYIQNNKETLLSLLEENLGKEYWWKKYFDFLTAFPENENKNGNKNGNNNEYSKEDYIVEEINGHELGQVLIFFPKEKVLCSADTLSPTELPTFNSLDGLKTFIKDLDVLERYIKKSEIIIPGHGYPLTLEEALGVLNIDRIYLNNLLELYEEYKKYEVTEKSNTNKNNSTNNNLQMNPIMEKLINLPRILKEERLLKDSASFHLDNLRTLGIDIDMDLGN